MKKKIVAAILAGVLALTGIVPFIAETFSVRAEEASVIGEWFGNIWGTPAVMTLDKDGAFSIKYDNKDKTELTGKWVQKENQILVNEGTDDDLLIDYDEKKETMTTQSNGETFVFTRDEENAKKKTVAAAKKVKESDMDGIWKAEKVETDEVLAPADLFGVNNVFLTVDDKKAGLRMGSLIFLIWKLFFQMELCRLRLVVGIWERIRMNTKTSNVPQRCWRMVRCG